MKSGDTHAERARRAAQLHETALAQASLGKLEGAIVLWGEAVGLDPDNVDVLVGLGNALAAVGEQAQAKELAQWACQLSEARADAWLLLGHIAFDDGDLKTALEAYSLAHDRAGDAKAINDVAVARARAFLRVGGVAEADAALEAAGDDVVAELLRGHVLAAQGRLGDARAAFTRAGERDPDHPEPYKQLAVLLSTSDRGLAKELAQHALLLSPGDQEIKALIDALSA